MTAPAPDLHTNGGEDPRVRWLRRGREIAQRLAGAQWAAGDWWHDRPAGADMLTAAMEMGLSESTLYTYGWVAGAFPPARRQPLSWSHHHVAAGLPAADADELLDRATKGRWTVARTREAAHQATREQNIEAGRVAQAEQLKLDLRPTAVSWEADAGRVEHECREGLVVVEARLRSIVDCLGALADHPGADRVHGNRRKGFTDRIRSALAPGGGTGVDLTPQITPLLDRIWINSAVARVQEASRG